MENYINSIAKVEKRWRFNAIIKVLTDNRIDYYIQRIPFDKNYDEPIGNIIIKAKAKDNITVICAHYDNFPLTPGANDNASACSILLNLILKYKDKGNFEFVFFDLEELGFLGSKYYLEKNKRNIDLVINLDMCGLGENTVLSANNISPENMKSLNDIFDKNNCIVLDKLPQCDANTFICNKVPTLCVINSTSNDVVWYKDYAKGNIPKTMPEFGKTMHRKTDTVDTINLEQVEKIYNMLVEVLNRQESIYEFK